MRNWDRLSTWSSWRPYPGQHHGIIERQTFDAVRCRLNGNAAERRAATNAKAPSLLTGLVYDETGDRLCPTHADKKGRRYRYGPQIRSL